jgi:hypothetical protein
MSALTNPIGAGLRQIKRETTGKSLQLKQDRAENLTKIDAVLAMRPTNMAPIGPAEFKIIGNRYKIPPVRLHVLSEKESGKDGGFQRDGRLTIMDEPAQFSKFTAHIYDMPSRDRFSDEDLPTLSYPKFVHLRDKHKLSKEWLAAWKIHPYSFSHRERWQLWAMWATQNFDAACMSISIGRFQVMGFHWQAMGFRSPQEMIEYAYVSEMNQLDLCLKWFQMNDLMDALAKGSWFRVAIYNGTADREAYAASCAAIEKKRCAIYA